MKRAASITFVEPARMRHGSRIDERMLVVHVGDLGLIVSVPARIPGIVNVCTHTRNLFPDIPIYCLMGGLQLGGVMEAIIPETVEALRQFVIGHIISGHCTGWRALHALANAFGDRVSQSAVGTSYSFAADESLLPEPQDRR